MWFPAIDRSCDTTKREQGTKLIYILLTVIEVKHVYYFGIGVGLLEVFIDLLEVFIDLSKQAMFRIRRSRSRL